MPIKKSEKMLNPYLNLVGHKQIDQYFTDHIDRNQDLHQAYIFAGPQQLGKFYLAKELARKLLKLDPNKSLLSHADCLIIDDDDRGEATAISDVRQAINWVQRAPLYGGHKVVIINNADRLRTDAQNALLKTIEEPSGRTIIFLISANNKLLLPTIVSRCYSLEFQPVANQDISLALQDCSADKKSADTFALLSLGRPGRAWQLASQTDIKKQDKEILKIWQLWQIAAVDRLNKISKIVSGDSFLEKKLALNNFLKQQEIFLHDLVALKSDIPQTVIYQQLIPEYQKYLSQNSSALTKVHRLLNKSKEINQGITNPKQIAEYYLLNI